MSGSGKARNPRYSMSDIVQVKKDIKLLYSLGRVNASPSQTVLPFVTGVHNASAPAGYVSLNVQGGSMIGPIALHPIYQVPLVTANTLDVSQSTGAFTNFVSLAPGTIVLKFITGAVNDGQLLYLRGAGDTTVDNTGNIRPIGGSASYNWLGDDIVLFIYENQIQKWVQLTAPIPAISGANTALSNLTNPTAINQNLIFGDGVTFAQGKDLINIDTLDFHSTSAFHPYIVGNGSNNQFNIGAHGSDIITLTNAFNSGSGIPDNGILQVFGQSHGSHGGVLWVPSLKTVNLSTTIVNGDYVGGIYMDALDGSVSHTQRTFGAIFTIGNSISGSLDGKLSFQTILPSGSGLQELMNVANAGIGVNVDIVPSGFATIQAGNVSFPFKNVFSSAVKYLSNSIVLSGTDMTYNAVSSANQKFTINSNTLFGIETDNTFGDVGYIDLYQNHLYSSATSGGASALPANPAGYHIILVNGVHKKIPYYNV